MRQLGSTRRKGALLAGGVVAVVLVLVASWLRTKPSAPRRDWPPVALPTIDVTRERELGSRRAPAPLVLMTEQYGPSTDTASTVLRAGIANAVSFHAPLTAEQERFVAENRLPFAYFAVPSAVGSCYPDSYDPDAAARMTALTSTLAAPTWLLALPEFDQGGGCWADAAGGRPRPKGSPAETYQAWMSFYREQLGLKDVLGVGATSRGHQIAATCVFAFCAPFAYDLGADLVLLERSIDEVSSISPGLAMIRGASVQNADKPWGIDVSTWRTLTSSPTEYDANGRLTGGWSPSWFTRVLFQSFMGGADIVYAEAADYTTGADSSGLNPLGRAMQAFGEYALTRHPDRGTPVVPIAIVQDHTSGFEPKFGRYLQGDVTWYGKLRYTTGDAMLNNLLQLAFPGHELHGTLVKGGPRSVADYRKQLANGADPRPWEPAGTSRWGESFDVLTNRASLAALEAYRAVVLAQDEALTDAQADALVRYVERGGTLVLRADQLRDVDAAWTGVRVTAARTNETTSRWSGDGASIDEGAYTALGLELTDASTIATTGRGAPLLTRHAQGEGAVYVIAADGAQDASQSKVLTVVERLIDQIHEAYAVAELDGPPVEYLVNDTGTALIVTVVNNSGTPWQGDVVYAADVGRVREYTTDTDVASAASGGRVRATVTVPAWDVRVFALEPVS